MQYTGHTSVDSQAGVAVAKDYGNSTQCHPIGPHNSEVVYSNFTFAGIGH